jgi:DNA-binding NarL/FixJ family response regulator
MIYILLADNRADIRTRLRALLGARSDITICGEASDGREAVDLACQKKPDVVVIDIDMPVMGGIEATRQIRQTSASTDVLLYTNENDGDLVREALRAGARGYLLKSASDENLIAAIEQLARRQISPEKCSRGVQTRNSLDRLKGLRILLVEDAWHVGEALKKLLVSLGAEVAGPAASVAEAEGLLSECAPDLALVDIYLRDGELADSLVDRLHAQDVSVIVISAYEALPGLATKVEGFLRKPFTNPQLLATLRPVIAEKGER